MLGADAVKDIQDPALDVGDDHVYPGKQFGRVGGGPRLPGGGAPDLPAVSWWRTCSLSPLGPGAARGVGTAGRVEENLPNHDRPQAAEVRRRSSPLGAWGANPGITRSPGRAP